MIYRMSNIGKFLLNKRSHAIVAGLLFSLATIFFFPLYICVAIIIALVTLHHSPKDGFVVLLWALTPIIAITFTIQFHMASFIILFNYVLVWLMAAVLSRYRAWGITLEIAAGCGLLAVFVISTSFPHMYQMMAMSVSTFIKARNKVSNLNLSSEEMIGWIQVVTLLAIGFAVLQMLLFNTICLIVSRAWQARMFNPGGFMTEFVKMRVSKFASLVIIIAFIAALFKYQFALQALPILMLPYVFNALSLVHFYVQKNPNKPAILGLLYLSCLVFYTVMLLVLTIVGIVDSWYDFRSKIVLE